MNSGWLQHALQTYLIPYEFWNYPQTDTADLIFCWFSKQTDFLLFKLQKDWQHELH